MKLSAFLLLLTVLLASCEPIICDEPVDGDCICTEEYNPVCGSDGKTYSNECFAKCAGVEVIHDGTCEAGRID